jgi:hypothetical protein
MIEAGRVPGRIGGLGRRPGHVPDKLS